MFGCSIKSRNHAESGNNGQNCGYCGNRRSRDESTHVRYTSLRRPLSGGTEPTHQPRRVPFGAP